MDIYTYGHRQIYLWTQRDKPIDMDIYIPMDIDRYTYGHREINLSTWIYIPMDIDRYTYGHRGKHMDMDR